MKGIFIFHWGDFQVSSLVSVTIGQLIKQRAQMHPDNECVVYPHRNIRWTYADFDALTDQVARGLMAMGIEKGDHVAIWATNVPEWLLIQFATAKIGAVLVTVNTNYKQFEIEYLLRQSDAKMLLLIEGFKDSNYVDHIKGIAPALADETPGHAQIKGLPSLRRIVYIGDTDKTPQGMSHFAEIAARADEVSQAEYEARFASLAPDDVINMQYTSGTTGFPKGVMLTHFNIVNNGRQIGDCMKFTEKDRLCIPVPLFHCFGCVLGVLACVTHGTTMVLVDYFHPVRVMEAVDWEKCTALHGVPTMWISILGHEDFAKYSFSALRTGIMAGSPCPIKVMREVVERMGASEITIAYGQTESSPVFTQTTTDDPLDLRVTTVGRLHPNVEGKIINPETGFEQPRGEQGEIITRGYHVMKGYYKMPEATNQAIDAQGWLHTGDIGVEDEAGYFKITGRLKDMIIRGGENVYPREIEEFLYTHPAVKDVQVVGVPDIKYGEEIMAYIIPNDGVPVTEEELIKFVKEGMSRYKAPRYVRFTDAFPANAAGKIQKFKLREQAIVDLKLQTAASVETA